MQLIEGERGRDPLFSVDSARSITSAAMDLLDSILGSMDKPPSLSDREKEKAKGMLACGGVASNN